ncbi:hypothetical protein Tco_0709426 [Tanacetum coccineum]
MSFSSATWDERLKIVEVKVSSFRLSDLEGRAWLSLRQLQLQLQLLLLLALALPSETKVSEPEPLTLEFELILEMKEVGLKYFQSGVKKADLVSFKISDKSSSFTFHEISSAPDSSFAPEVVWAVFNPFPGDLVLSTRTLRLDPASM